MFESGLISHFRISVINGSRNQPVSAQQHHTITIAHIGYVPEVSTDTNEESRPLTEATRQLEKPMLG